MVFPSARPHGEGGGKGPGSSAAEKSGPTKHGLPSPALSSRGGEGAEALVTRQRSSNPRPMDAAADVDRVEIFSDEFNYAADSGSGIYRGNVRVASTNLALSSGLLTAVLPMRERRLAKIIAEQAGVVGSREGGLTG